jgi:hypothetical protein
MKDTKGFTIQRNKKKKKAYSFEGRLKKIDKANFFFTWQFNSYTKNPISSGVFITMTAKKVCPNFSSDKTEPNFWKRLILQRDQEWLNLLVTMKIWMFLVPL